MSEAFRDRASAADGHSATISRRVRILRFCAASALLLCCGCSAQTDGPTRVAVEGTVTWNGKPLPSGSIVFIPIEGTTGPRSGAPIRDGQYYIPKKQGPVVGKHRVEIRAELDLGFDITTPEQFATHANKPLPRNPIPPRYNERSELVVETTVDGPNQFDFDLTDAEEGSHRR